MIRLSLPDGTGIAARYRRAKASATYVFLHGFGDGAFVWSHFVTELPLGFGILLPDFRGHGRSSWDSAGTYNVAQHASDIAALIDALGVGGVVLVGHSLGGTVAVHLCAELGARVVGLVLVDCAPTLGDAARQRIQEDFELADRSFPSVQSYAEWLGERRPLISSEICRMFANASLMQVADGSFRRRCDPALARAAQTLRQPMEQVIATLSSFSGRALLLRGRMSGILDRQTVQQMAQAVDGSVIEIAMAGHAIMAENPQGFSAAVLPFLNAFNAPQQDPSK